VYLQGEGGEDIIAKVPGGCSSAPGEVASYALMPEHCHLFDAAGFALPRRVH
jgi:multiple sugar transport system ATP-binding protein